MKLNLNIKRSYGNEYDYRNVLAGIEIIKKKCRDYELGEYFDTIPTFAFKGIAKPESSSAIKTLELSIGDELYSIGNEISGENGWDAWKGVADIVKTTSGIGMNDWHWTLNTYRLKPEYAQLLIDELVLIENDIKRNYDAFLEEKRKKDAAREAEDEAIRNSIVSISTDSKEIEDECRHTMVYTHKLKFPDGEELTFIERSIFDFGTVINPDYAIKPGAKKGGLCMNGDDGKKYWYDLGDDGWIPVRELSENEETAFKYLGRFGKYAKSGIRM